KTYVFHAATRTGDWTGDPFPIPAVFPMEPVPAGGYGPGAPPEVAACDKIVTTMLKQLDDAWGNGGSSALNDAVGSMISLKGEAIALLNKQIKRPGGGIFGPQFRKVSL
ncbi:MAG: hypothetical protein M3Z36_13745, partial [Acidobacteriota bacterium]|nr:hypothetical protein [Acidobacteriota bacterium]